MAPIDDDFASELDKIVNYISLYLVQIFQKMQQINSSTIKSMEHIIYDMRVIGHGINLIKYKQSPYSTNIIDDICSYNDSNVNKMHLIHKLNFYTNNKCVPSTSDIRINKFVNKISNYINNEQHIIYINDNITNSSDIINIDSDNIYLLIYYIFIMITNNLESNNIILPVLCLNITRNDTHIKIDIDNSSIKSKHDENNSTIFRRYMSDIKQTIEYRLVESFINYIGLTLNIVNKSILIDIPYKLQPSTYMHRLNQYDNLQISIMMLYTTDIYNNTITNIFDGSSYNVKSYQIYDIHEYVRSIEKLDNSVKSKVSKFLKQITHKPTKRKSLDNSAKTIADTDGSSSSQTTQLQAFKLTRVTLNAPNIIILADPSKEINTLLFEKFYTKIHKHWPNVDWLCLSNIISVNLPNVIVNNNIITTNNIIDDIQRITDKNYTLYKSIRSTLSPLYVLIIHHARIMSYMIQSIISRELKGSVITIAHQIADVNLSAINSYNIILVHKNMKNIEQLLGQFSQHNNIILIGNNNQMTIEHRINKFLIEPITIEKIQQFL
jgi:hypothetical protein